MTLLYLASFVTMGIGIGLAVAIMINIFRD